MADRAEFALPHVLAALTAEEKVRGAVYLDTEERPAGTLQVGVTSVEVAAPCLLVFIDDKPGANWAHACRYLVLDLTTGETTSIAAEMPPAHGPLPSSWRLVWQAPGTEPWQLLPLASRDSA